MNDIIPRKEIMDFARAMEMEMRKHDDDYGDNWKEVEIGVIINHLRSEFEELEEAITRHTLSGGEACPVRFSRIREEAADVANFAMFIHFLAGES